MNRVSAAEFGAPGEVAMPRVDPAPARPLPRGHARLEPAERVTRMAAVSGVGTGRIRPARAERQRTVGRDRRGRFADDRP